jgi:D-alanyl-D-alanine carboxypeptidase (penicillin-binding protein 5/6)
MRLKPFLVAAAALTAIAPVTRPADAQGFVTAGREAILIDMETETVLYEKNPDQPTHPASMSKLMTVYLVFERLKNGSLKMTDSFPVSVKAWKTGGSKMFTPVGGSITVEKLLHGIIVQSGNDACVVMAEGLAGSEEAFAELENKKAKELGLTGSTFANASGLPDPRQIMTVRDIALLSEHLIRDFPEYYNLFSVKDYEFGDINQGNRNPLLYKNIGVDGLKTGHTSEAGYGLAASGVRNGRRLVLVVTGLKSMNERSQESERLLEYGFREFDTYKLFAAGDKVEDAKVWLGQSATVPLTVAKPLAVTMPKRLRPNMQVKLDYTGPVPAPVAKGVEVGKVIVTIPEYKTLEVPVVAGDSVGRLGTMARISAAVRHVLMGSPG